MAAKAKELAKPRSGRKFSLGFGLVSIAVQLKPLAETARPVPGKGACPKHGPGLNAVSLCTSGKVDHVVPFEEKQILYPHPETGELVYVDPEVWKALEEDRTGNAAIEAIVPVGEIDPVYIEKTYIVWPQQGFEQQFDLLSALLDKNKKAAIVTAVYSKQTQLFAFRFVKELGCMVAHVIHFEQRIRHEDAELVADAAKARPKVDPKMIAVGEQLLSALEGKFDPGAAQDVLTEARQDAIRRSAKGQAVKLPKPEPEVEVVDDVMATLMASVAGMPAAKPKKNGRSTPRSRKKVAA
jgi:DNA end-binding protein Ku